MYVHKICTKTCGNNCGKNCAKNCTKLRKINHLKLKMQHIRVLFRGSLPFRLEKAGDRSSCFSIPKSHRLKTVQFMNSQPQHTLRKGKKSWEVIGTLPLKMKGGRQNNYRLFLSGMKKSCLTFPIMSLAIYL